MPLDAGVNARGTSRSLGNRQTVQNKDGGVVTAIHVREGQHVKAGQVLIELAAPELRASERALTSDYLTLLAQRARLLAERIGQRDFAPPAEFASLSAEDRPIADAGDAASASRDARASRAPFPRSSRCSGSRGSSWSNSRAAIPSSAQSLIEQQRLIGEELAGLQKIAAKGFASMNRVRELQREQADAQGPAGADGMRNMRGPARASARPGCSRCRSSRDRLEKVEADLKDTQSKLSETLPKLVATREQLEHSLVRAPATGQVVGLTVFTVGGVVAPGQKLMDVVPDGARAGDPGAAQPDRMPTTPMPGRRRRFASSASTTARCRCSAGRCGRCPRTASPTKRPGRSYFRAEIVVPEASSAKVQLGARPRRASPRLAGRGRADGAQANRARISHRAAERSALALGPRGLSCRRDGSPGLIRTGDHSINSRTLYR